MRSRIGASRRPSSKLARKQPVEECLVKRLIGAIVGPRVAAGGPKSRAAHWLEGIGRQPPVSYQPAPSGASA